MKNLTYAALASFVAVLWFATLPSRPLFNPDEGRYAEIPREMMSGGDWIIPHLDGVPYIEKPPLQYWATAISFRTFGLNAFGARFYTAICALGTLISVWVLARGLWNWDAALRATAVLAGMLLFVVLGQLLTLDMSLTFYMTAALAAFIRAQPAGGAPVPAGTSRRWMLGAWAAVALGVLTKGPVAALIPAAVLMLYSVYTRDVAPWRRLQIAWGLPLLLAITVPWHWLAARHLADFLQFYFVHEHVARYLTRSADREEAWWFFGAVLALGSMPWTLSGLRVLVLTGWRRGPGGVFDATSFLWLWVVFIGVFFSLSDSKLIPYILPALPALALLIGGSSAEILRREASFTAMVTILAGAALIAAGAFGSRFIAPTDRSGYFLMLAKPLTEIGLLLGFSGLFVLFRCRRDLTRAVAFLGVGWCLAGMLLMRAATAVAPVYSGIVLAQALADIPATVPIYSVATYDQTLPFYWRRTLRLVAYRGELDFGLDHDPDAELPTVTAFLDRWQPVAQAYAVMEQTMFEDLKRRGVPMRELARDVHRVLVSRR